MDIGSLLLETCRLAVDQDYLLARQQRARWNGMTAAVRAGDTPFLFGWLVEVFSYQGIADARALAYMDTHGRLTYGDVARGLEQSSACSKLATWWHFTGCGYTKTAQTCGEPDLLPSCPLPRHDLRNGRLNQMAYALFLFVRDVCAGNLVGWIDDRLAEADNPGDPDREATLRDALLAPMCRIHGVSFKVLAMAMAELLLAGDPARERWVAAGAVMIAVDTLVHNWLHRTGIAQAVGNSHPYGRQCYAPGGCAPVLERCSRGIDTRLLCPEGPAYFPRLVQHAVWQFCAEGGLNVCNGNRINDRVGCLQFGCPLSAGCAHLPPL